MSEETKVGVHACLLGEAIYGDDFDSDDIEAWFLDEAEGYGELVAMDFGTHSYGYHALNTRLGFRHLPIERLFSVLGFGGARGDELLPIIDRIDKITIVDPSENFVRSHVHGIPAQYVKPMPSGDLPSMANAYDLITCLGVLHHIPNVSHVMRELNRVLAPGGHMLVREPIVSMGDWRRPRRGLTKRERGIPLHLLLDIVKGNGLVVLVSTLCAFPLTPRLFRAWSGGPYNSSVAVAIDTLLSKLFAWNVNYHPTHAIHRLRPTSVYLVLHKPAQ